MTPLYNVVWIIYETLLIPCVHSVNAKVSDFYSWWNTISVHRIGNIRFRNFFAFLRRGLNWCVRVCYFILVFLIFLIGRASTHKNPNFVSAVCSEIGRRSSVLWSAVCFLSSYLHSCSPPIIHGNLTCDTIFIQHNGLVKIGSGNHIEKKYHEIHFFRKNMCLLLIQLVMSYFFGILLLYYY